MRGCQDTDVILANSSAYLSRPSCLIFGPIAYVSLHLRSSTAQVHRYSFHRRQISEVVASQHDSSDENVNLDSLPQL